MNFICSFLLGMALVSYRDEAVFGMVMWVTVVAIFLKAVMDAHPVRELNRELKILEQRHTTFTRAINRVFESVPGYGLVWSNLEYYVNNPQEIDNYGPYLRNESGATASVGVRADGRTPPG